MVWWNMYDSANWENVKPATLLSLLGTRALRLVSKCNRNWICKFVKLYIKSNSKMTLFIQKDVKCHQIKKIHVSDLRWAKRWTCCQAGLGRNFSQTKARDRLSLSLFVPVYKKITALALPPPIIIVHGLLPFLFACLASSYPYWCSSPCCIPLLSLSLSLSFLFWQGGSEDLFKMELSVILSIQQFAYLNARPHMWLGL